MVALKGFARPAPRATTRDCPYFFVICGAPNSVLTGVAKFPHQSFWRVIIPAISCGNGFIEDLLGVNQPSRFGVEQIGEGTLF